MRAPDPTGRSPATPEIRVSDRSRFGLLRADRSGAVPAADRGNDQPAGARRPRGLAGDRAPGPADVSDTRTPAARLSNWIKKHAPTPHKGRASASAKKCTPIARPPTIADMSVRSLSRPKRELRPVVRDSPAGPVVKWVGGKTKLLPELLARMPARFGRYFEPFAGGAALFFRVAPERAVLADSNSDLIGLYTCLASDVAGVIRRLEHHRAAHSEAHYYATRTRWNDREASWSSADRAATFIYLNKTCFNGLWRVNRAGAFNVPIGRYTDPPICVPQALRAASALIARAVLRCADYRAAISDARRGDFVYFDPPYDPVAPTANFTSYTTDAFGADDQRALADVARGLVGHGCQVMLSNSDTPFIRSLYKGFQIDRVKCSRAINSNAARRGEVDEVIITAGY
jgi:DNA adenine methylase